MQAVRSPVEAGPERRKEGEEASASHGRKNGGSERKALERDKERRRRLEKRMMSTFLPHCASVAGRAELKSLGVKTFFFFGPARR
jgi:hypothetical protein